MCYFIRQNKNIFDQEMFGSVPIYNVDMILVENYMFENLRHDCISKMKKKMKKTKDHKTVLLCVL